MTARPAPPVERVRSRLRGALTPDQLDRIPDAYERLGRVAVVRLPEELRPAFSDIGTAYRDALGVETVLRRAGPVTGEFREPTVETIAGGPTETELLEHGIRYRLDVARIMFSAGNREERRRVGRMVRPGETVADLFAGIGYFTLPAAVTGRAGRVAACELNPNSYRYLVENLQRNRVADRVEPFLGDNRLAPLPPGEFDRVFLGYLPDAVPWLGRALPLLRPDGGWLHVHRVEGVRPSERDSESGVRTTLERLGGSVVSLEVREVKPYGPGRRHVVVDVHARPSGPAPENRAT